MARNLRRIPKLSAHKASGQACIWLDGKRIYLGPAGSTEASQEYARIISKLVDATPAPQSVQAVKSSDWTINELALLYLQFAEGYYVKHGAPTKELASIKGVVRELAKLFGDLPAVEFTPGRLKFFRQRFIERGLVRARINQHVGRVRRFFKWSASEGLLPATVWHGLQCVDGLRFGRSSAKESLPVVPVDDAWVDAVRPYVAPQVWAMIQLQRLTGCRPGEAVIMRGCDLDLYGAIWEYRPSRHKTEHHGRDRLILIGPQAQAILKPWLRSEAVAYLFQPMEAMLERRRRRHAHRMTPISCGNRPGSHVKSNPSRVPRDHYTTQSYGRAIAYACRKAGIAVWAPNQLRHAAATQIRKHHGLEAAQVLLGHASADVTQIYAEADVERARAVIGKIG